MTRKPCGLDLVRFCWDYDKSPEDNLRAYREAYREVYGEYPPPPSEDDDEERAIAGGTNKPLEELREWIKQRKEQAHERVSKSTDEQVMALVRHDPDDRGPVW